MKFSHRLMNYFPWAMLLVLFQLPTGLHAQSAEDPDDPTDVIDVFLEALGGEMALLGIETLSAKVDYTGWTSGSATFRFKNGKRLENTSYGGATTFDTIHDGEQWIARSTGGGWSVVGGTAAEHSNELDFCLPTDALRLQSQADEFEIVPKDVFSDHDYAHCVCLQLKDGKEFNIRRFFNPDTGFLECAERWVPQKDEAQKMHIRIFEMKYEEFEGFMFLKSTRRTLGDEEFLECAYSDFSVDQPIDDELFEADIDDD